MTDAYLTRELSIREIAAEAQCAVRTIARWMKIHAIPARTGADAYRTGAAHHGWRGGTRPPCQGCGAPRESYNKDQTGVCQHCRDRRGESNSNWRGDAVGPAQLHGRVKLARGRAGTLPCAHCGEPAQDWAYDHSDPNELPSPIGPYSLDVQRYAPLCRVCHKRFDLASLRRVQT